jgi:hypothetical protein
MAFLNFAPNQHTKGVNFSNITNSTACTQQAIKMIPYYRALYYRRWDGHAMIPEEFDEFDDNRNRLLRDAA